MSLFVLVLIVLGVAAGALRIQADFSVDAFYGRRDPATVVLREYLARWGADDMLLIVAEADGPRGLLARDTLQAIDAITRDLAEVEGVGEALSPTQVPRVRPGFAGQWIPVPLVGTAPPADAPAERITRWQDALLGDPTLVPTFLSADGRYASIMLALDVDGGDLAQVKPVVRAVEAALEGAQVAGVRFRVGGVPAIRADVLGVIVRDQVLLVPIAGGLMTLLLALLFRSRHGVLIPGVAAGVPIVMLLGVMGWTGEPFGLLNQVFLALVPAIAVADAVHLVSRYHEEAERLGGGAEAMAVTIRDQAIVRAMAYMGLACFLTSFTTIVGFLSLLSVDMPVLRSFGVYASVGVALAYFTVLLIVPLALLSTRSGARHLDHDDEGNIGMALRWSHHLATQRPGAVILSALAFTAVLGLVGSRVQADWKVTETFDASHPVSQANTLVDDHLGGVLALELDLEAAPGTFERPDVLAALVAQEEAIAARAPVRATVSIASVLAATSQLIGGPYAAPESESLVARLSTLADRTGQLGRFVDDTRSRARILVRTRDLGAVQFLSLGRDVEREVQQALAPFDVAVQVTGSSYVAARGVSRVTTDMRDSLLAAFGIVGVMIAGLFRSVRYGLLSVLPNLLPLVAALGLMGVMGWTLEPGAAVVFTISVGISVDSAIHVFARYREERDAGASIDEALRGAIFHSGRAILITTLILAVGFAVNINSSAPANAAFGRLGTVIILGAMVSNLVVLPALIKRFDR